MTTTFKQFFLSYFPCSKSCLDDGMTQFLTAPRAKYEQIIERGNYAVGDIGILTDRSSKSVLQTFDRFQFYHIHAWEANLIDMEQIQKQSQRRTEIFDAFTLSIWQEKIPQLHQETQIFFKDFVHFPQKFEDLSSETQSQLTKGGAYNSLINRYKQSVKCLFCMS